MRTRHTRRSDPSLGGPTSQHSVRLPTALVRLVQSDIAAGVPEVHSLTDAATDALWLWHYENSRGKNGKARVPVATVPVVDQGAYTLVELGAGEAVVDDAGNVLQVGPDRPRWADVDLSDLDLDEPANLDGDG